MNSLCRSTASFTLVFAVCTAGSIADTHTAPPLSDDAIVIAGNPVAPQTKTTPKQAIQDGLLWLARHQNPDGSWGCATLKERCVPDKPCWVEDPDSPFKSYFDEGLTGLALLGFLRAGYGVDATHEFVDPTTEKHYKTAEVVTHALEWLTKCQNAAGAFQHERVFMYSQAIATIAMCEGAVAQKNDLWKASARRGVAHVLKAQRPRPEGAGLWGWRYATRDEIEQEISKLKKDDPARSELADSDTSVTAWCTAALAAGVGLGFEVKPIALDGALAFCDFASAPDGRVGYLRGSEAGIKVSGPGDQFDYHSAVMSALAMSIRMDANKDRKAPFFDLAAQQVLRDLPTVSSDRLSIDYYYWYQASLALNRLDTDRGGAKLKKKTATPWNKALTEALLSLQDKRKDRCSLGGWIVEDRWSHTGGVTYCTAMAVLALEACNPK